MGDKETTNSFIDKLFVEFFLFDYAIKSQTAITKAHEKERKMLNSQYLYLLNIQENRHKDAQGRKLRELRKRAKELALKRGE